MNRHVVRDDVHTPLTTLIGTVSDQVEWEFICADRSWQAAKLRANIRFNLINWKNICKLLLFLLLFDFTWYQDSICYNFYIVVTRELTYFSQNYFSNVLFFSLFVPELYLGIVNWNTTECSMNAIFGMMKKLSTLHSFSFSMSFNLF